ncbi:acetylornithine deacetylase [Roseococcus sp. SYP-B2431]|uniref:acetylornithine deacetylase n=1 Tax=Roseococcus sp. SYP-B2431 TaxID=2496640 RepID=UPI0010393642|nr:acetylornithine deacetylase [Roseococcus sp. SYP-B2431]TCH98804.1 acetylornithine deacetylase [Roseococcus sp. SYP-B2431]
MSSISRAIPLRAISLLERLVAFDTTSARSNAPLIEFVRQELAAQGVESRVMMEGEKANLHAIVGPRVAGGIALSAHVDCVPVEGQAWLGDPFLLRREDGRLIGRGACDMKGFLACILAMLPEMLAADLARPFHLCLTHDEETTFRGADRLMDELGHEGPPPALCIVGEPSGMAPIVAHKGYASWEVVFTGLSGHSSRADETANALMAAAEAVAWLKAEARGFAAEGRRVEGFVPPYTTVHAGTFHSGSVLNIVPDRAEFTFEVRNVPGDTADDILARFVAHAESAILPELRRVHPASAMTVKARSVAPALDLDADHPLLALTQRASGSNSLGFVSYGTEAGYYQRAGIPAIVCGPGHIAQAHQPEEWIAESQIEACCAFLGRLIEDQAR